MKPPPHTIWGRATPHGEDTSGDGDISSKSQRGARPQCPFPLPLLFLHIVPPEWGTLIVSAVGVLRFTLYFYVRMRYKKRAGQARAAQALLVWSVGSWWFPQISFHTVGVLFFSPTGEALVTSVAGVFRIHRSSPSPTVRHLVGYGAAAHRRIISSSYTISAITGENKSSPPWVSKSKMAFWIGIFGCRFFIF